MVVLSCFALLCTPRNAYVKFRVLKEVLGCARADAVGATRPRPGGVGHSRGARRRNRDDHQRGAQEPKQVSLL